MTASQTHIATVFAALNAFIIPVVYLFFPETAGRSLEGACTGLAISVRAMILKYSCRYGRYLCTRV